jgi:hypothetical protein
MKQKKLTPTQVDILTKLLDGETRAIRTVTQYSLSVYALRDRGLVKVRESRYFTAPKWGDVKITEAGLKALEESKG